MIGVKITWPLIYDRLSSNRSHFSGACTKILGILRRTSQIPKPGCELLPELLRCTESESPSPPVPANRRNLLFPPQITQKPKPKFTHNFRSTVANGHKVASTFSYHNSNRMTMSSPIEHEFAHYNGVQLVSSPSRPKSQSIMIKRSRGCEDSMFLDNSSERMYDWATWRMYHRITSSRKDRVASIRPMDYDHEGASISATKVHGDSALKNLDDDSLLSIDYSHLGEVFEIDL